MRADRVVLWGLLVALLLPAAGTDARSRWSPRQIEAGRFTVVSDRRPERLDETTRRLVAQDRFLTRWLGVPAARLEPPVTLLYLRRTRGMHRKLPFRGDRIGHEHLLPTDTRTWLLVHEEGDDDDLRPAVVQLAEYALFEQEAWLWPWMRSGLYELLARVDLRGDQLILHPSSFPALHEAGLRRATLAEVGEKEWSRYQHPRRWYTSALVVAYLFEEHPDQLAEAIARPRDARLEDLVDADAFDAWAARAVEQREAAPRVLEHDVPYAPVETTLTDDQLRDLLETLALTHDKGPRAFGLNRHGSTPRVAAVLELRAGEPGEACAALAGDESPEGLYLRGLCIAGDQPRAAEELLRQAFDAEPGLYRAAVHAAALALLDPDPVRAEDAGYLARRALEVCPADADAQVIAAVAELRTTGWTSGRLLPTHATLTPPWDVIQLAPGPMDAVREGLRMEVASVLAEPDVMPEGDTPTF